MSNYWTDLEGIKAKPKPKSSLDELSTLLAREVQAEIDREILRDLRTVSVPEISIITSSNIIAQNRKLKAQWTYEAQEDIAAWIGVSAREETFARNLYEEIWLASSQQHPAS